MWQGRIEQDALWIQGVTGDLNVNPPTKFHFRPDRIRQSIAIFA